MDTWKKVYILSVGSTSLSLRVCVYICIITHTHTPHSTDSRVPFILFPKLHAILGSWKHTKCLVPENLHLRKHISLAHRNITNYQVSTLQTSPKMTAPLIGKRMKCKGNLSEAVLVSVSKKAYNFYLEAFLWVITSKWAPQEEDLVQH